jgi:hypothetical protein
VIYDQNFEKAYHLRESHIFFFLATGLIGPRKNGLNIEIMKLLGQSFFTEVKYAT